MKWFPLASVLLFAWPVLASAHEPPASRCTPLRLQQLDDMHRAYLASGNYGRAVYYLSRKQACARMLAD